MVRAEVGLYLSDKTVVPENNILIQEHVLVGRLLPVLLRFSNYMHTRCNEFSSQHRFDIVFEA